MQGYSYLWDGVNMFEEEVEAWQHGPVLTSVYREFKKYGLGNLPKSEGRDNVKNSNTKETIKTVLDGFKNYSGYEMAKKTQEESPWLNCDSSVEIGRAHV